MSGDSFKPEVGGEDLKVVNPDEGNTEIDAQLAEGDAMNAAESEAMEAFTSIDDEATEEEIETEEVTEDLETAPDETDEETTDEVEEASPQLAWDGNPDNLPEELVPTYKSMLRGFHSKTKELAEAKKETESLQAKLLLKVSGGDQAEAKAEGPPPLPTGENITQEAWNEAVTKQNEWYADRNMEALKSSDKFVSADKFNDVQLQATMQQLGTEIESLPGYSEEAGNLIMDAVTNNAMWSEAARSHPREAYHELARQAIAHVGATQAQTVQATKATEKIKKQATAASRATPRVTSPKGASAEDVFAKEGFKNDNEKMEYAERHALEEYGG